MGIHNNKGISESVHIYCAFVCVYAHTCVSMCVCVYIYIYTHTFRVRLVDFRFLVNVKSPARNTFLARDILCVINCVS